MSQERKNSRQYLLNGSPEGEETVHYHFGLVTQQYEEEEEEKKINSCMLFMTAVGSVCDL